MNKNILKISNEMNDQLFNFINHKVNNSDLSKDIIQDVFIKVFLNIDSVRNKDKIVSWTFQITRNEIITHYRKFQFSTSSEELPEQELVDDNLTAEFSTCMLPMINSLPEKYKEVITLSEINNVSQKEMAEKLNISYSGGKSKVQRGRELLKVSLLQCCSISVDKYGNVTDYKSKKQR